MSFHNVEEVEQALRTPRLAVRALHEIWDRRLPIPEPAPHKTAKPGGDGRLIAWVQEDLRLASHFCRQCFESQDFQLICDAELIHINLLISPGILAERGAESPLIRVVFFSPRIVDVSWYSRTVRMSKDARQLYDFGEFRPCSQTRL